MSQPRPDVHQPQSLISFNAGKLTEPWTKSVVLGVLENLRFSRFGGEISRTTIRRVIRYHYGRKWRAMQRIPLSRETARQRFLWCQAWREDIDELLETIFSDESPHEEEDILL
ncbi:uncharacterized protein FRV6_08984 [Fusarium oxysporum]|uniref:Transposase Tc1-like domain-containing protein n=1 Tax=Fusarium oxysporum TaxID=5507 RepID=A0A2H3T8I2_FUSOX|nr:uncharacterized protein FRV6_08984 [Fusarium oxysporum]